VINMNFLSHPIQNNNAPLSGKYVAERLGQMRSGARAILALSLTRDAPIARLSRKQAARLTGVSRYSIALAAIATPAEGEALHHGTLSLKDVRKAHARPRNVTDDEISTFIDCAGPDRVLAHLDAMTAPALSVTAE
jgi:hypothetical protein